MSHSPAIFLQHAISASVMAAVGKHASTGAATHRNSKSTNMERRIISKQIVTLFSPSRKESDLASYSHIYSPVGFHRSIIPPANRICGGKPYAPTRVCGQSAQLSEGRCRNGIGILNAYGSSGVCGRG